jgi:excisionase family DNA binding protein
MSYKHNYIQSNTGYNKSSQRGNPLSEMLFENRNNNKIVDENERWLTTDEAAYYLNISSNALRILVHRARVKAYKLGSRLRFKKSDLFTVLQLKED